MAATATQDRVDQKPYKALLDYLADGEIRTVEDVQRELKDRAAQNVMGLAWIDGVIEFGRRVYVETGEKSATSARAGTYIDRNDLDENKQPKVKEIAGSAGRYIIESGISWTGGKRTTHKPFKDLLAEDVTFKPGCIVYEQQGDGTLKRADAAKLKLLVRVTDKGFAVLAA